MNKISKLKHSNENVVMKKEKSRGEKAWTYEEGSKNKKQRESATEMCATREEQLHHIGRILYKHWRIVILIYKNLMEQPSIFFDSTSLIWFVSYVIGTYKSKAKTE